jgi:hypothetical protein
MSGSSPARGHAAFRPPFSSVVTRPSRWGFLSRVSDNNSSTRLVLNPQRGLRAAPVFPFLDWGSLFLSAPAQGAVGLVYS